MCIHSLAHFSNSLQVCSEMYPRNGQSSIRSGNMVTGSGESSITHLVIPLICAPGVRVYSAV